MTSMVATPSIEQIGSLAVIGILVIAVFVMLLQALKTRRKEAEKSKRWFKAPYYHQIIHLFEQSPYWALEHSKSPQVLELLVLAEGFINDDIALATREQYALRDRLEQLYNKLVSDRAARLKKLKNGHLKHPDDVS